MAFTKIRVNAHAISWMQKNKIKRHYTVLRFLNICF